MRCLALCRRKHRRASNLVGSSPADRCQEIGAESKPTNCGVRRRLGWRSREKSREFGAHEPRRLWTFWPSKPPGGWRGRLWHGKTKCPKSCPLLRRTYPLCPACPGRIRGFGPDGFVRHFVPARCDFGPKRQLPAPLTSVTKSLRPKVTGQGLAKRLRIASSKVSLNETRPTRKLRGIDVPEVLALTQISQVSENED